MEKNWCYDKLDIIREITTRINSAAQSLPAEKCKSLLEILGLLEDSLKETVPDIAREYTEGASTKCPGAGLFGKVAVEHHNGLTPLIDELGNALVLKSTDLNTAEFAAQLIEKLQGSLHRDPEDFDCLPQANELLIKSIDIVLGRPSLRLACYGTLRPGEKNHHHVADIAGEWRTGTIRGFVWKWNNYPVFTFDTEGPEIVVSVLESSSLPESYHRLDEFEGADYKRTLVPVHTPDGFTVCNIYEANVDPP